MHRYGSPGKLRPVRPDPAPGEFDDLLRAIEKEAVPERLLDLALRLQAALVERRGRQHDEGDPADA